MRIGIVTQCYLPTKNGVVASIETFHEGLEAAGHQVFIFTPSYSGFPAKDETKKTKQVFPLPSIRNLISIDYPLVWPWLPNSSHLKKLFQELKLDIIHAQHQFGLPGIARRAAKSLLIPFVCTYHTDLEEYTHYLPLPQSWAKAIVLGGAVKFLNQCDARITPSGPMAKRLLAYGVKPPLNIIKTGIHVADYQKSLPGFDKRFQVPDDYAVLLYAGRIAKEKNLIFLIDAFAKIKKAFPKVHLVMAGGGPEEQDFHQMVKKRDLASDITFTGFLERAEVNEIYHSADLFVFTSLTDTQGIVITEAMAAGTPVVAIDKMGPSEIVVSGTTGYLSQNNQADFVSRVLKLLHDRPLQAKMGIAAKIEAQKYSIETTTNQLIDIYQQTIDQHDLDNLSKTRYTKLVDRLAERG